MNSSAVVIQLVFNVCRCDFSCGILNCSDHNCTNDVIIISVTVTVACQQYHLNFGTIAVGRFKIR